MKPEQIISQLRSSPGGRVTLHLLLWLCYFGAIFYLSSISFNAYRGPAAWFEPLKVITTSALVFYPLVYFIYPVYFARKRYVIGTFLLVVLIIAYTATDHYLERAIVTSCEPCMDRLRRDPHGYYRLFQRGGLQVIILQLISLGILYQLFVFISFPLAVKIAIEYVDQRLKTLRLQQENTALEFGFLKAQVNPHFLFNTLNNIYALILKGDQRASSETVARLASFMRYSLDGPAVNRNNIVQECRLLELYVELEKIRLNDTVVNFICKFDREDYTLPPLLFMPAVENAFKYCSNPQGDAYIFIRLEATAGQLLFVISNTFDARHSESMVRTGIGLQNLQRRLAHYYPNDLSTMSIENEDGVHKLSIKLKLA